jgi:hypothetical protein
MKIYKSTSSYTPPLGSTIYLSLYYIYSIAIRMGKKKSKSQVFVLKPWCWYCEREFEDEKGKLKRTDGTKPS